jgi:hypothetical protein
LGLLNPVLLVDLVARQAQAIIHSLTASGIPTSDLKEACDAKLDQALVNLWRDACQLTECLRQKSRI